MTQVNYCFLRIPTYSCVLHERKNLNHTFVCNNRTRRQHARLFMEHEWSMFSRRIIHPAEDVRGVRVAALDQVLLPHRDRSTVFGQCRLLKPWGHTLRSKSSLATTLGHLPWAHKQATTEEQFNMVRMKAYSTSCVTGRHKRSYMGPDASKRVFVGNHIGTLAPRPKPSQARPMKLSQARPSTKLLQDGFEWGLARARGF